MTRGLAPAVERPVQRRLLASGAEAEGECVTEMSADALVIGAGVVGSSIALQLARAGLAVTVLDRNRAVGAGSTSASSAVVRFHYSTLAGVITSWESKFGWESWGDFLGHDDPAGLARYITTGGLVLDSPGFALDRVTALFTDVG